MANLHTEDNNMKKYKINSNLVSSNYDLFDQYFPETIEPQEVVIDDYTYTTPYYFAYGSNLDIDQMIMRCPDAEPIQEVTLHDWRLVFRGVADIEQYHGSSVLGVIFKISDRDEDKLDIYEGYPTLYHKEFFPAVIDGEDVDIMFYKMTESYTGMSLPNKAYFDTIHRGYEYFKLDTKELFKALTLAHKKGSTGRVHYPKPKIQTRSAYKLKNIFKK